MTERRKNQNLERCGFRELTPQLEWKVLSYSKFMGLVHKAEVNMNRKVLADLAMNQPEAFKAIVAKVKELA